MLNVIIKNRENLWGLTNTSTVIVAARHLQGICNGRYTSHILFFCLLLVSDFRDSSTRTRSIIVSSSVSGTSFTYLFEDESTLGTADDASDTFSFPTGSTGQYVRLTGTGLDDEDWLSILEVRALDGPWVAFCGARRSLPSWTNSYLASIQ